VTVLALQDNVDFGTAFTVVDNRVGPQPDPEILAGQERKTVFIIVIERHTFQVLFKDQAGGGAASDETINDAIATPLRINIIRIERY
jgi:hypothetical protein